MSMITIGRYQVDVEQGFVFGRAGQITKVAGRYVSVRAWPGGAKYAHRIIWEAVNGPIPSGLQINHKNGIRTDNRIENLELVTPSENTLHAFRTGLASAKGTSNGRARLTEDQVREIRRSPLGCNPLANQYGMSRTAIRQIRNGSRWGSLA